MKKLWLWIGIGVLALALLTTLIVGLFLGNIVKAGLETFGPKVTQTALTVSSVNVGLLTGSGGVNNLVLGNPDDYKAKEPNAIIVGKAAVSLAPLSVLADKIIVKSVEVRSPEINFIGNPLGANNLKKIMENVNSFTGGAEAKPTGTAPAEVGAKKSAKKLEVDDFLISGAKVRFNGATLPLPDIHFTDLGKGPEGITPGDLIKKILGEITTATLKAVVSSVGDAGKALGNDAEKIGKNIGKSLGGLFK